MNRFAVFLLLRAAAQAPGNGISKSTYSCNDPIAAKRFLYKYFPVATPGDECTNDTCICDATSSTAKWEIQQGRVYVTGNSSAGDQMAGRGFGLHCVNVSNHLTTGGLSTAEVEAHFISKLGDMKDFDAFMDFSVTFYATDLAKYAAAFDKDAVPYYTTSWQDKNGQSYTSLFVQVAKSQMILELTSKKGLLSSDTTRPVHAAAASERRMSSRAVARIEELSRKGQLVNMSLTALSVNRAVSSAVLEKLDDFYINGMGTKKVSDDYDASASYARKCYLWNGAEVEICFTNRADNATKGTWKVSDFEQMLNTVHKNIVVGDPFCQVDKWEDNHYSIDAWSMSGDHIVTYINKNSIPHVCQESGGGPGPQGQLHYAFDPTGWGIQMDLSFTTKPADCQSSSHSTERRLQGTYNPACNPGTCAKSAANLIV